MERAKDEVLVAKYVTHKINVHVVSDIKEIEDKMSELKNRFYDDDSSDSEEEEVEVEKIPPISAKKTESGVSFKDTVSNEPKLMLI